MEETKEQIRHRMLETILLKCPPNVTLESTPNLTRVLEALAFTMADEVFKLQTEIRTIRNRPFYTGDLE